MFQIFNSKIIVLLGAFLIIIPSACILDESSRDNNLMADNLLKDVLENPEDDVILGQIIASAEGNLEFEMISSDPIGALRVDSEMGTLHAAMPELFDYEERTVVSGVVKTISGEDVKEVTVTFNILDVEAPIEDFNKFTKNWKTDKFSWNGVFSTMDMHSCRLDDQMSLSGTGNYTFDGGELCGEEDNQQFRSGTWSLDENLRFIIFDKGSDKELRVDIDNFQDGRLSLSTTYMGILVSGEYIQ